MCVGSRPFCVEIAITSSANISRTTNRIFSYSFLSYIKTEFELNTFFEYKAVTKQHHTVKLTNQKLFRRYTLFAVSQLRFFPNICCVLQKFQSLVLVGLRGCGDKPFEITRLIAPASGNSHVHLKKNNIPLR